MNKIFIVRHGQTDWNKRGLLQGTTDIEINEQGIKEAKFLAPNINLEEIDICLSSPLKRAMKTAEILTQGKVPIISDDLLLERYFGSLEGKEVSFDLIKRQWDYKLNDKSCHIESVRDCLERARKFLEKIKKEYPNKVILIVSHGSFIKALHFNIVGYDENTDFLSFSPQNTTLYEYTLK